MGGFNILVDKENTGTWRPATYQGNDPKGFAVVYDDAQDKTQSVVVKKSCVRLPKHATDNNIVKSLQKAEKLRIEACGDVDDGDISHDKIRYDALTTYSIRCRHNGYYTTHRGCVTAERGGRMPGYPNSRVWFFALEQENLFC